MTTKAPGIKLLIFVLATALAGFGVATVVGNMRFGSTHAYQAVFSNASGLGNGEDVKVGGVPMGKVKKVELAENGTALVSFSLSTERPLTSGTTARVKYKNLIGDRYIELSSGSNIIEPLDGPIPLDQTTPALDLDQVVNGFRPLLQGLDPEQTNQLSTSLIEVLNGQEASIGRLVTQVGSLSTTLADRDQAIGRVVTNFNTVVGTVNQRGEQFSTLLDQIQQLVAGLDDDRDLITNSLVNIDNVTSSLSEVLEQNRPSIQQDIVALGELSGNLNRNTDTLNLVLSTLPENYRLISRVAGYGSFVNFFVCGLAVKYASGPGGLTPMFKAPAERCQ
ncbi:MCE family protein [Rhodococcus qingshengii]|jgi:phospholipid/cholesterol/gamma-HCH transport system substrate-binding protein|uniref:MCE family protein n=1 Tax=Rhodococcus TaxID=1827 RepID=UPI001F1F1602|nr:MULTISPECIES: MCE family protein [Rhodococcus]MCE4268459.1 MCE family protein [Rhodococcus globerulus]MDJ0490722.1 MCE family protein [Rhodococcus qingshengii]